MIVLKGQITDCEPTERRGTVRRQVRLSAKASMREDNRSIIIWDLSETGFLIECPVQLQVGEKISVALVRERSVEASVKHRKGATYGCEFDEPIPSSILNLAVLTASSIKIDGDKAGAVEEIPIGTNVTLDMLSTWKADFDSERGTRGWRLIGFRQNEDGMTVALVAITN